jgi:hypothetical protein
MNNNRLSDLTKEDLLKLAARLGLQINTSNTIKQMLTVFEALGYKTVSDVDAQTNNIPLGDIISTANTLIKESTTGETNSRLERNLSIRLPESTNPIHFSKLIPMDSVYANLIRKSLNSSIVQTTNSALDEDENASLDLVDSISSAGNEDYQLNMPASCATDSKGNYYIADPGSGKIKKFNGLGDFERAWSAEGIYGKHLWNNIAVITSGVLTVFDGLGKKLWEEKTIGGNWISPRLVDMDSDGESELVALNYKSLTDSEFKIYIFRKGSVLKEFKCPNTTLFEVVTPGKATPGGLVFFQEGGSIITYTFLGAKLWESDKTTYPTSSQYSIGDIDNDGIVEIISLTQNNKVVCYKGLQGIFMNTLFGTYFPTTYKVMLADLFNNGFQKIIISSIESLQVFNSNGALHSTIAFPATDEFMSLTGQNLPGQKSWYVSDIDNDGENEIIVIHLNSQRLSVFGLNEQFKPVLRWTFAVPVTATGVASIQSDIVIEDLNGDGFKELVFIAGNVPVSNGPPYPISFVLNHKGERIAANNTSYLFRSKLYVGDIDFDGKKDILWINSACTELQCYNFSTPKLYDKQKISISTVAGTTADFNCGPAKIGQPISVAVDFKDTVWVLDASLNKLLMYDPLGELLTGTSRAIGRVPYRLTETIVAPLVFVKASGKSIFLFNKEAKKLFEFPLPPIATGPSIMDLTMYPEIDASRIVALDKAENGDLYMVEWFRGWIHRIDKQYRYVGYYNKYGFSGLGYASGLSIKGNNLFVSYANAVIQYTLDGEFVRAFNPPGKGTISVKGRDLTCITYNKALNKFAVADRSLRQLLVTMSPAEVAKKRFSMTSIDLRAQQWVAEYSILLNEKQLATKRHALAKINYENAISTSKTSISDLDNYEGQLKKELDNKIRAEKKYKEFLNMLRHEQIDVSIEGAVLEKLVLRSEEIEQILFGITRNFSEIKDKSDVRTYTFVNGEYIDQFGIPIHEHVLDVGNRLDDEMEYFLIIPFFQSPTDSNPSHQLIIRNPIFSGKQIRPASFHFEEQYIMDVNWSGIGLGEFSHSVNLFPGEERELQLVTSKKKSWETVEKIVRSSKSASTYDTTQETKRNDSFETALQASIEKNTSSSVTDSTASTSTSSFSLAASVSGGFGPVKASVNANYAQNSSRNSANASTRSLSSVAKNARNMASKASGEVSNNNKVSFVSSSDMQEDLQKKVSAEDTETETTNIKIRNINEGKTVNYNFFQVTNIYSTLLRIEDAKVHISTGIEVIPGTGITINKTYEIEDVGSVLNDFRIYSLDDRKKILAAISLQIVKYYMLIKGDRIDDSPQIVCVRNEDTEALKALRTTCTELSFSDSQLDRIEKGEADSVFEEVISPEFIERLVTFGKSKNYVQPMEVGERDYYVVNSGKYYVDAQVGIKPATEDYLESRREIETQRQKALVEELKARTKAGVFFQELPKGVTSLAMEGEKLPNGSNHK